MKVGKWTSFPRSVKLKPGETVVFSWITYKSRAHRDRVNAKVMKDKRLAEMMDPKAMPFDGKRMIYGGIQGSARRLRAAIDPIYGNKRLEVRAIHEDAGNALASTTGN